MRPNHRRGVTLIELLVVIAIITVIATMLVAVAPRFGERQRASRGAAQLQSWLNLAKQRALRDQRQVGLRLPSVVGSSYVTEALYVELPSESVGTEIGVPFSLSYAPSPKDAYRFVRFASTANFLGQTPPTPLPTDPIQIGDVINFPDKPVGNYAPRRIVNIQKAPSGFGPKGQNPDGSLNYLVELDQSLPQALPFVSRPPQVSRLARPVVGEPIMQLPKDIAIDITQDKPINPTWYRLYPPLNSGGTLPFDILFAPTGQVVGYNGISRICLWVRDTSLGDPGPTVLPPGENTLITVYTRTGHVTAHPVDPSGLVPGTSTWNPFKFTQDGLSSGQ
jgi:prepilin-type N-terminal cleavage/methylation domain-containing protein